MMKTVQEYSVLAGLNLDVRYGAIGELETFNDDSFANVNVIITNHNGNVIELKVMDSEFSDRVYFVEDEMMYTGFNVVGITEIKDINEKRAFAQAQYTLNEMTIQEIIVTATLKDGTVTPLKVNDYNMDVTSIQEM